MLVPHPDYTGHNTYLIMMGDTDRALDLNDWGNANDGTKITAFCNAQLKGPKCRVWKFERINDDSGEETPRPTQIQEALLRAEQVNKAQEAEIVFLRQLVLDGRQQAATLFSQIEWLQGLIGGMSTGNSPEVT
ncbi:unnamed protein product [Rhizoctonia solani]|uniref:Uncharacterized protein n=1 Tax=Rhizoctonia solani TaxID=456999 RepID=A0A8H3BZ88_9AGAM|nr:unnamed protein product [Rhizoctonia solani]